MHKGMRVKYSQLGLEELKPKNPKRTGTVKVVSQRGNQTLCTIVWDGVKTPYRYAVKFLEEIKA